MKLISKARKAWRTRPANRVVAQYPPECPECDGEVMWDYTCHTYQSGGRWSSCLPCDSAVEYECSDEECGWGYTHGLDPDNPRSARNEESRPAWLSGKLEWTTSPQLPVIHPKVKHRQEVQG